MSKKFVSWILSLAMMLSCLWVLPSTAFADDGAKTPQEVYEMIEGLFPVTYKSVVSVKEARQAYEALSAAEKEQVDNADRLEEAEDELQALHDAFNVSVVGWPASLANATTSWMDTCSAEEQALTRQALADEMRRLYVDEGYKAGPTDTILAVDTWAPTWTPAGVIINVEAADSDNIGKIHGNPWGFAQIGTILSAPYVGMAFSQTRYMSQDYVAKGWPALLSDTFLYNGRYYSVTWNNVKSYDSQIPEERGRVLTAAELTYEEQYPGKGLPGNGNNTFRYALAKYNQTHKSDGLVLGIPAADAVTAGEVAYQVYEGPSGAAYIAGSTDAIAAAAATPKYPEGAYAIAGKLAEAFVSLGATDAERFAVTGAPVGDAYEAEGLLCQDFQLLTLAVNPDTGEVIRTSNDTALMNFAIEGGRVLDNVGDGINILVPAGTDLTNITPTFTIHPKSAVQPAAGPQDFSEPVTYTVTSELGVSKEYVVTVIEDGPGSAEDAAAAAAVSQAIDQLPAEPIHGDAAQIEQTEEQYLALTPRQKYLVQNTDALYAALEKLEALKADKIRVACIGDSITEGDLGDGDVVPATSYPTQLQEMLGERYEVRNFGKCGICLSRSADYSYWNLPEFQASQEFQPDIVIIMLGTNDVWGGRWGGLRNTFESDYTEFVNIYKSLDSQPAIYLTKVCADYGTDRANVPEVNEIVERVAQATDCELADMFTWTNSLSAGDRAKYFPDNLHPTARGYTLMAGLFKEQIFDSISEEDQIALLDGRPLRQAFSAAEEAIDGLKATNETTADQIFSLVEQAVDNDKLSLSWSEPFKLQKATYQAPGAVTGTLELKCNGLSQLLPVNKTIDQLTGSDEEIVEAAKAAAEEALAALTPSNTLSADAILEAVAAAVEDTGATAAWTTAYSLEPATDTAEGRIQGAITLTYGEKDVEIPIRLTIPKLTPTVTKGDVNGDGDIDIQDVMAACRILARKNSGDEPSGQEKDRVDMNGDETVDIQDIMLICRVLARNS